MKEDNSQLTVKDLKTMFENAQNNSKSAIQKILSDFEFISQNQQALDQFTKAIKNAIESHPEDARNMTIREFIITHVHLLDVEDDSSTKVRDFILDISSDITYNTLPFTALTNLIKTYMNNPTRVESPRHGRISVETHYLTKDSIITYKGIDSSYTLTIERVKELFAKRVQNGAKIFNFLLQKLNDQNYHEKTEFMLEELVDAGIYSNTNSAYKGVKTVLDKLMRMHVEGTITVYENGKRKQVFNAKSAIVGSRVVSFKKCVVSLPPIIRDYAPYITILPRWGYALSSENAYMLLDYIYYLARQNTEKLRERGYFTINLDSVRMHLGLPSPEDVKDNANREYNKLIIRPVEDAIVAIEDQQKNSEITITPIYDHDYNDIHEYLTGYLEIRLSGVALAYMEQRAIQEKKQKSKALLLEKKKAKKKADIKQD